MKRACLQLQNPPFLSLLLIAAFIWSLFSVHWGEKLFHPGGMTTLMQILSAMAKPDLSVGIIKLALQSAWRTLAYASAGMSLALVVAFPLGILASGVLAARPLNRFFSVGFFRGLLGFMRAIHELVWAWLFAAAIGLSPYAAILALAIPYGGILGRIFADLLNDVPGEPLEALATTGAGKCQILLYGRLPLALADMLSYTMYRFECAIRSAAIMSFIGLGGLGYQIQVSLQDLKYNETWTFIFFLVALIILVDIWSSMLRRKLVM